MKTSLVQISAKASSSLKNVFRHGSKTALVLLLFMVCSVFAQSTDASSMTAGIDAEITALKPILYGIAGSIIGVAIVFVVYRFVRRMLG